MEEKLYFSKIINDYEKGRQKYPKEIFEEIINYSQIGKDSHLLEVGAGPGTATDGFLDYKIDVLEISDKQVDFLKRKYTDYENIIIKKSLFEKFNAEFSYDLLYSGTAFHWINPETAYAKAADCLKVGGTIAVFWNVTFGPKIEGTYFGELQYIVRKYCSGIFGEKEENYADCQKLRWMQEIYKTGEFTQLICKDVKWYEKYNAEQFVTWVKSLQSVYSVGLDSEDFRREITEYFDMIGGFVEIPCSVFLIMAKKVCDKKAKYKFITKENMTTIYQLEELGITPEIVENHFLNYADEIIYVMKNEKVYGIITPNDLIRYYRGEKKSKINRNFKCLKEIDVRGAEMIFSVIPSIHEVPVIKNGEIYGVIRSGRKKSPTEWKNIRFTIQEMVGEDRRLSLCDLFKSMTKAEQKLLLGTKFEKSYIKLFETDYESRNF